MIGTVEGVGTEVMVAVPDGEGVPLVSGVRVPDGPSAASTGAGVAGPGDRMEPRTSPATKTIARGTRWNGWRQYGGRQPGTMRKIRPASAGTRERGAALQ